MYDSRKKVFITGVKSFTGKYLVPSLENNNFKVINFNRELGRSDADAPIDLLDQQRLHDFLNKHSPDYIIHLAGITNSTHPDPRRYYEVNVIGTLNLLKALGDLSKAPKHIILASSANIYGDQSGEIITETSPIDPVNNYAASKVAMELMAKLWQNKLPITIVRPFNYTGVGQSKEFLIPKIVEHYKRASNFINLGNLDVSRDFSDVRSVVDAYLKMLDHKKVVGKTVNICSGKSYSIQNILDFCERLTGHSLEVRVDPHLVRPNEIKNLMGDPTLLNFYAPNLLQISLEDTLRWMLTE